jgi:hypothetical protein
MQKQHETNKQRAHITSLTQQENMRASIKKDQLPPCHAMPHTHSPEKFRLIEKLPSIRAHNMGVPLPPIPTTMLFVAGCIWQLEGDNYLTSCGVCVQVWRVAYVLLG